MPAGDAMKAGKSPTVQPHYRYLVGLINVPESRSKKDEPEVFVTAGMVPILGGRTGNTIVGVHDSRWVLLKAVMTQNAASLTKETALQPADETRNRQP